NAALCVLCDHPAAICHALSHLPLTHQAFTCLLDPGQRGLQPAGGACVSPAPCGPGLPRLGHGASSVTSQSRASCGARSPQPQGRISPQATYSSQAASEPGPDTPPPARRSKHTKVEQAAEPTQPTKGNTAKAKPASQPGSAEHAVHWGEQVEPTGAVLLARAGSSASQGQGVP
ncbi:hypothetical protein HaLaN_14665, partial [Haematococcus lacustris]